MLDKFCKDQYFYADIAGMCVSARRGDVDFKGAYGYADFEKKIPMEKTSLFPCASLAKLITADLVMDNLEIDENIVHMLSHTTGISEEGLFLWKPEEYRFSYDDASYDRLGLMLEKKTGKEFRVLAEERLKEIGMARSSFSEEEIIPGHHKDQNRNIVRNTRYRYEKYHLPSSGLVSDIYDLDKLADRFMDTERYEKMWQPVAEIPASGEHMGLGFFIWEIDGHTLYGHDAGDYGYRGTFWVCPELDINITVLVNHANGLLRKTVEGIFRLMV